MWNELKQKAQRATEKVATAKTAMVVGTYLLATNVYAQGKAQQSATALTGTMKAFLGIMNPASKLAGVIAIIGGLWSLYKHYKSQGRDGSIAAGIAGVGVGVALFFLGGMLSFGADTIGIDQQDLVVQ